MKRSLFSVTFAQDGNEILSRYFSTLRAARSWAKWLSGKHADVKVYEGQPGGMLRA